MSGGEDSGHSGPMMSGGHSGDTGGSSGTSKSIFQPKFLPFSKDPSKWTISI